MKNTVMIQTKDLRIGNIILDDEMGKVVVQQITSPLMKESQEVDEQIVFTRIYDNRDFRQCDIKDCRPIHLTEEILLKSGFKVDGNKSYWLPFDLDRYVQLIYSSDGYYPTLVQEAEGQFDNPMAFSCNRVQYLHQLQNLYHSLTGYELNLQL